MNGPKTKHNKTSSLLKAMHVYEMHKYVCDCQDVLAMVKKC